MKMKGVACTFHYVPLHSSPYGIRTSRVGSDMKFTNDLADRIVRLPLWPGLEPQQNYVIDSAIEILNQF